MLSSVTFCGEAAELGRASDARLLPDAKEEAAVELLRVPDDRRLRVANEAVAVIRLRAMAHRRALRMRQLEPGKKKRRKDVIFAA